MTESERCPKGKRIHDMEDCGCGMAKGIQPYLGILNANPHITRITRTWRAIKQRCNNPNSDRYYSYGQKGIKLQVNIRKFISWYLEKLKLRKTWNDPTVDRIDNRGNYCFCNIQLLERKENWDKSNVAFKQWTRRVAVFRSHEKEPFFIAFSIHNAAVLFNRHPSNISKFCKKALIRPLGFYRTEHYFKFYETL